MQDEHPYARLSPDMVLEAVESTGLLSDLRILTLNSYENRVYQVGVEDAEPVIAKFYRPGRWSDQQILEEHQFSAQLAEDEVPVVPPWRDEGGRTLFEWNGFRFSLYRRHGGRAPALDDFDHLFQLGRLVARIHLVGAVETFTARPALDLESFGEASVRLLLEQFIPTDLRPAYESLSRDLLKLVGERWAAVDFQAIRVHGDCHVGNILWRDEAPHFVDLDDARQAPAVQDLWMFMSGSRDAQRRQLTELVEGYQEFRDFDAAELALIESLRTLRIMHYNAWLGRRWNDPAFPRSFPWFNTARYWGEHILQLREQLALLHEPPLELI